MFVRYYVEVDRPFEDVRSILLNGPERWVPGLATESSRRAELLLAEVGFGASPRLEKRVLVELKNPMEFPSRLLLPMEWRPVSAGNLFPTLDADIEVAPLGPKRTHLSISARYQPPLGMVGQALDRALLHRIAEATVKDFLDRVAERLTALDAA